MEEVAEILKSRLIIVITPHGPLFRFRAVLAAEFKGDSGSGQPG